MECMPINGYVEFKYLHNFMYNSSEVWCLTTWVINKKFFRKFILQSNKQWIDRWWQSETLLPIQFTICLLPHQFNSQFHEIQEKTKSLKQHRNRRRKQANRQEHINILRLSGGLTKHIYKHTFWAYKMYYVLSLWNFDTYTGGTYIHTKVKLNLKVSSGRSSFFIGANFFLSDCGCLWGCGGITFPILS